MHGYFPRGAGQIHSTQRQAVNPDTRCRQLFHRFPDVHSISSKISNVLTLTPESTATGIGLRLYKNNDSSPLSFGPNSSIKGNLNQWKLSAGTESMPSVVLRANYINTNGSPTAGTVNGVTTITFSYQ
ncbi:type 1 fimbrial protein [Salmonella enterica subsp. enterica serovar Lexington]|nr:type 1 fimbrial protein [Salmonella enterica subsp. enterica serovar Lexington]EAO2120552.1 type 1 fimbrial protein [Salmonella enterica]MIG58727.1 type 1 fimbrial protein [Salmonella enterica subsp. houtenae]EAA7875352.1 type 1 fimbrial protein [Salmonella enterica subsp. enterica serovar Lexington]EBH8368940.1 type 1 fimbrial protein [Salmonella enterica subsp. enterica serovar Lexington]